MAYILSIDQSTSGTKGMIFNVGGELVCRYDVPHKQITNALGYIEHDPEEIYRNTVDAVKGVLVKSGVPKNEIGAVGISNQRETVLGWNAKTGKPVYNAIVWQCCRAAELCKELEHKADFVFETTGLNLSPYFSGPKIAWMIRSVPDIEAMMNKGHICFGTIDTWLIYKLTNGESYKTDYSNASRTGLMNINTLKWDQEMIALYGLDEKALPEICDSDSVFGYTDFEGLFPNAVPICGVLGDSHAALFANNCIKPGMAKVTFGTGSSVMINVGDKKISPKPGIVASLAWGRQGQVEYVLEGNINYSGAVIKWLVDDVQLIQTPEESALLSKSIEDTGGVYLVPAFTGLGAPYWNNEARAVFCGMNPTTKKAQLVRAAVECIAYQIRDVFEVIKESYRRPVPKIFGDGGATRNDFLMSFVSGILNIPIEVSQIEELSGAGAAYMAALSSGLSTEEQFFSKRSTKTYMPQMKKEVNEKLYSGWKAAVGMLCG